ncbi:trypsin-like peptidase domain-containing protein [Marinactinospora thermotolerans]|uniref:Putative serine protease PepD n=1 Tax=Marinactinospora thermotolerans DSM 45154 TaxID=1122192 RepID=A0A1T4TEP9_9ACTN|nr:trypsin-like peptidase domain-containing protein [Marinactinospora thermotolerans]SKA38927.1 putative serine protease PepD [Marinactinospora thermotolerans DSM 45154]
MSATDPADGTPQGSEEFEGAGATAVPPAGETRSDPLPDAPSAASSAPSQTPSDDPAPTAADQTLTMPAASGEAGREQDSPAWASRPDQAAGSGIQRSEVPNRPLRSPYPERPPYGPPAGAWSGPHASPSATPPGGVPGGGAFGAGFPPERGAGPGGSHGGFASPPPPPHGPFGPASHFPSGPGEEPQEPRKARKPWSRGRVVAVAGATALVTSLIVGPTAAVVTTHFLSNGGGAISSLAEETSGSVSTGNVSTVADATLPSVVSIQTGNGSGGSGVVISSDGQILTNNHVVSGAGDNLVVQFNDGSTARAEILGADPVSDLAVIKAEGRTDLTPAKLGDSDKIEVGADVVAIGSPLGLSGTVTSGVISAVDRPVNTGSAEPEQPEQQLPFGLPGQGQSEQGRATTSTVIDAIQTDAPINPGNSGGPLMNMQGEVIGINTAIATTGGTSGSQSGSIGLGFAIPINQAKPIAEQLIETGSASYAAIDATITAGPNGQGARIVDVANGGAAQEAGLKADDVITRVGDRVVTDPDVLIAAVRSHQPGETVTVTFERDGKSQEVQVTLSGQSADSIGS